MRNQVFAAVVLCFVTASAALATSTGSMYVKYGSSSPSLTIDLSLDYNHDGTADFSWGSGRLYSGVVNLVNDPAKATGAGVAMSEIWGQNIQAFCIELPQNTSSSFRTYSVKSLQDGPIGGVSVPMSTSRANQMRELFGRFWSPTLNATSAAAFQACLWEIEYERQGLPLSLGNGSLVAGQSQPQMQAVANMWLSSLNGDLSWMDNTVRLISNGTYQDFVFANRGLEPVPEPVTVVAIATALGGLGLYVRKRTKITPSA